VFCSIAQPPAAARFNRRRHGGSGDFEDFLIFFELFDRCL